MNLKQALTDNKSIRLGLSAETWQEAVKLSVEPLIESGAVQPQYYDAIVESTEEYGPYYILMPGMAMPHARPEAGVNRDAFSLITLTEPVTFSDGKEVSILLSLAATRPFRRLLLCLSWKIPLSASRLANQKKKCWL